MSNVPPPPPPGGGFPPPPAPDGGFNPPPAQPGGFTPPAQGGYAPYGQAPGGQPASFGARLGGYIIDGLIIGAMSIPGYIYLVAGPKEIQRCDDSIAEFSGQLCEVPTGGTWAVAIILFIAAFIGGLAYIGIMGGKGATVGQKSLGLRLVDQTTGQPVGTGRAIGRYFAAILSAIPCYLGFLWMLWDDDKQCWHDKMTSSVVIKG